MRRKERELQELTDILAVINECEVCRVAFFDDEFPYLIPFSFGFKEAQGQITLYFHCANEGKKLDLMRTNNRVAFEMDCATELVFGNTACDCTTHYKSVCGTGVINFVGEAAKREACVAIMEHYQPGGTFEFSEKMIKNTTLLALEVASITGKQSPAKRH